MERDRIPQDGESNIISVVQWVETQFSGINFREKCLVALRHTHEEMRGRSVGSPEWHALLQRGIILGDMIRIDQGEPVSLPEVKQFKAAVA